MARVPSYRLHKPSGQAVVTLRGMKPADRYLGKYGSPESRAEYARLLVEWEGSQRAACAVRVNRDPTVRELVEDYWDDKHDYYSRGERASLRIILRAAREAFGDTPAKDIGPLRLKAFRETLVDKGWKRQYINQQIGRVVRVWRWGVENEMVPAPVHQALRAVEPLKAGRTTAPESAKVGPVAPSVIQATIPHLSRQLRAVVDIQRLTGARGGEILAMRMADIDCKSEPGVWIYTPRTHKTAHRGKARSIMLGPDCQNIIRQFAGRDAQDYLFDPGEARAEMIGAPVPAKSTRYTAESYARAIARVCAKHGIEHWHPHQIRHTVATEIRRTHGLEVASVVLGHSSAVVTEAVYAERDREMLANIARSRG